MIVEKPRFRVAIDGSRPRIHAPGASAADNEGFVPWAPMGSASSFEAAGYGRRLRNFIPSRAHINAALEKAGRTLIKRARFLVENNGYAGNAVDVWVAWLIGEGITPEISSDVPLARRKKVKKLWQRWIKEADAEGLTNFYGLQEKVAREAYIGGECFVRRRQRRPRDMRTVPMQLQVLPSEMLDLSYNEDLGGGNYIRMGVEFNPIGRRVAYHFWKHHPDDFQTRMVAEGSLRTRVPAGDVIHVFDARQGGQIRGVPRMARTIVKLFAVDVYDDAELDRKKTAALYAGFVTKAGEGSPLDPSPGEPGSPEYQDETGIADDSIALQPGGMLELEPGENVEWSSPADVGGSYEPFQYRTLLQVCSGLGVPYAYCTGDTTRGNFSNVRTEIMNFRRRIGQHQFNVVIPQLCETVWEWWLDAGEAAALIEVDDDLRDEDWLPPKMEYIDPNNDVTADVKSVRAGFKTRGQVIAQRGYGREEIDDKFEAENADADRRGFIFDTDPRRVSAVGMTNAVPTGSGFVDPDDEVPNPQDVQDTKDEVVSQPAPAKTPPRKAAPKPKPKEAVR